MRTEIDVMKLYHYPNVVHLKQKYKVEEKRKSVYKSNCERNKIVEVDCQGTKKNNNDEIKIINK